MTTKHTIILVLVLLAFLTMTVACDDGWDGMDRTSDEFNGVRTKQAEGLPLDTPTPELTQETR
jgi:hypothetical protein